MATIATLMVSLGMNTAKFEAGSKRGRASLADLGCAVALNSTLGILGTVSSGIGAVISHFEKHAKNIDDVAKMSDRLGLTTQNLVAYQHAASLAGVASDTLDGALQKMNINIAKAAQGDSVSEEFQRIGLNAKQLLSVGADKALEQIADAINKVQSPAERAATAVAIFGKSGAPMLTLLQDGSIGLQAMRKEADELGITFDRLAAQQVEQANDALTRAKATIGGFGNEIVMHVAPALRLVGDTFTELKKDIQEGNVADLFKALFTGGLLPLAEMQEKLKRLDEDAAYAAKPQKNLAEGMDAVTEAAKKQSKAVSALKQMYDELNDRETKRLSIIDAMATPMERLLDKESEIEEMLGQLNGDRGKLTEDQFDYRKSGLETALERVRKEKAQTEKDEFGNSFLGQIQNEMKTPLQKYREELKKIEEELGDPFARDLGLPGQHADEERFAQMQARRRFIDASPGGELGQQGRSAALLADSSAAFSASFGAKPADKKLAELAKIDQEILDIQRRLEKKLGNTFPLN